MSTLTIHAELDIHNYNSQYAVGCHQVQNKCARLIFLETWILYNGKKHGLSKVVKEAYKNYEDIEFKTRAAKNKISDPDRHVKLVNIAGKEVKILRN